MCPPLLYPPFSSTQVSDIIIYRHCTILGWFLAIFLLSSLPSYYFIIIKLYIYAFVYAFSVIYLFINLFSYFLSLQSANIPPVCLMTQLQQETSDVPACALQSFVYVHPSHVKYGIFSSLCLRKWELKTDIVHYFPTVSIFKDVKNYY